MEIDLIMNEEEEKDFQDFEFENSRPAKLVKLLQISDQC